MNHQVEDDVDVEAALGKRAEPMDFDEARIGEERPRDGDRRIEALGVADGQHDARVAGGVDHLVGFVERARHRLLDQHGDAPPRRNGSAMSAWSSVGTAIVTASTRPMRSR